MVWTYPKQRLGPDRSRNSGQVFLEFEFVLRAIVHSGLLITVVTTLRVNAYEAMTSVWACEETARFFYQEAHYPCYNVVQDVRTSLP
jgi:hypothetical protein